MTTETKFGFFRERSAYLRQAFIDPHEEASGAFGSSVPMVVPNPLKPYWLITLILSAFLSLFSLSPQALWAADAKPTLRISGSSTLLPVAEAAAEVYLEDRPDLLLTVSGTGTGEGIRSIIEGNIDIADASRDLKAEEIQRAARYGADLVKHSVALDCLAVIVHPSNPVQNITMEQLRGIYIGEITNWREVGGEDMVIVPINRDSSSGTFEMWIEEVLLWAKHRPDAQVQSSSGGVAFAVSGNKHALGYVSLGFLSPQVKALSVNEIKPSIQTAADGSYPIKRELYMFVHAEHSVEVDKFLAFMSSPAGEDVIRKVGFIPAKEVGGGGQN
ncbi:MAG: phosphate ABC transporter substrate-binding protein [Deltaproteobacteria bacterium]|jgi:phosphate transport system substrate-binding protein|nr:phosphate ABC transporter substrate-binding protein [Deltaproteobacteria bacterium]